MVHDAGRVEPLHLGRSTRGARPLLLAAAARPPSRSRSLRRYSAAVSTRRTSTPAARRAARVDARHPGQRRHVVRHEPELEQLAPRAPGGVADQPSHHSTMREPAPPRLLARPRERSRDVVGAHAGARSRYASRRRRRSSSAVDRLERRPRQQVDGGVLGQLCARRCHACPTLPRYAAHEPFRGGTAMTDVVDAPAAVKPINHWIAGGRYAGRVRAHRRRSTTRRRGEQTGAVDLATRRGGRPRRPGREAGVPRLARDCRSRSAPSSSSRSASSSTSSARRSRSS